MARRVLCIHWNLNQLALKAGSLQRKIAANQTYTNMKKLTKYSLALMAVGLLGCGMFSTKVHATPLVPIVGSVAFEDGDAILNGPLATATAVTGYAAADPIYVNPNSIGTNGDYAGTGNSVVTFAAFTFSPALSPNPVNPLWTFTSGLDTYSFSLSSVGVALQNSSFLDLSGLGTLSIKVTIGGANVYTPTLGNFTFDIQSSTGNPQDTFEFTASNAALPDGGWTVALLGVSLAGLEIMRRRMAGRSMIA